VSKVNDLEMKNPILIMVYLDDGRIFEYGVSDANKAREHVSAIGATGYRHTSDGILEHYPVHRITKIKAIGTGISTAYPDRCRGT
jgi:hypothetical protein